jgi:hypothetical protein
MVQVPSETSVTDVPEAVQTDGVLDVSETARPELEETVGVSAVGRIGVAAGWGKVITCSPGPVTAENVTVTASKAPAAACVTAMSQIPDETPEIIPVLVIEQSDGVDDT